MASLISGRTRIEDPTMKVEAPYPILSALAQTYDTLSRIQQRLFDLLPKITNLGESAGATIVPSNVLSFARRNVELAEVIERLVKTIDEAVGEAPEMPGVSEQVGFGTALRPVIEALRHRFPNVADEDVWSDQVPAKDVRVNEIVLYRDTPVEVTLKTHSFGSVTLSFAIGASCTYHEDELITLITIRGTGAIKAELDEGVAD